MTEKVLFLYDNKVDDGTVSAASEAGALVAANLQDRRLSKVARTTGLTGQYWAVDFGETVELDTVALWAHNMGLEATIRLRFSANADCSAPVYDVTEYAIPALYGLAELGLGDDGFGGVVPLTEFAGYPRFTIFRLGARFEGRYLLLDPLDAANPDGYFQAGRLIAGVGFQPARNFSFGWSLAWVDPSDQQEMEDGGVWVDQRDKYREVELPFNYATKADALASFSDLQRIVGSSRDLLVAPFPETGPDRHRTAIYGIPVKGAVSAVRQSGLQQFSFSIKVRELV